MGPPGQFVLKVLEDTGSVLLLPAPCIAIADLQLTAAMLVGPVAYIGNDNASWTLPPINASQPLAGGSLIGRQVHIHNASSLTMNLGTYSEYFGFNSFQEECTIAANGSIGLIGSYEPLSGAYFWQPMYLNGVTLAGKRVIIPDPGNMFAVGLAPTRTP